MHKALCKLTLLLLTVFFSVLSFTPLFAGESGLLIALRSDSHNKGEQVKQGLLSPISHSYRTFWIYPEGNTLKVIAGKGIIVPRDDGFWKVGSRRITDKEWTEDVLYSIPGKKKIGKLKMPDEMENTGGFKDLGILFVGNNYISVEVNAEGYTKGAAHPFHFNKLMVMPLDNPGKSVKIGEVIGKDADDVLMKDAADYLKRHPDDKDRLYHEGSTDAWGLIRRDGEWVLRGFIDYSCEAARGNFAHYDISLKPPSSLVSHDKLVPSWRVIRRSIPDAIDAFSSPESDILGVVSPKYLRLYLVKNKVDLLNPTKKIPLKKVEFPVMIQWATGEFVDKWTGKMKKYLK